jgi:hypothetical protein
MVFEILRNVIGIATIVLVITATVSSVIFVSIELSNFVKDKGRR